MSVTGQRTCPNCDRPVQRGEMQCPNCGETLAVGPFGSSNPRLHYLAGMAMAGASLFIPAAGAMSALFGLGLWTMHGDRDAAGQVLLAALVLGAVGLLYHGTLVPI